MNMNNENKIMIIEDNESEQNTSTDEEDNEQFKH